MVFIMSTHHHPPPIYEWTAVGRVRDAEAEFERDMWGFSQLGLQNVGQRARDDTPFLCHFHSRPFKTWWARFLFVSVCVWAHMFTCWDTKHNLCLRVFFLPWAAGPWGQLLLLNPDYLISVYCWSTTFRWERGSISQQHAGSGQSLLFI